MTAPVPERAAEALPPLPPALRALMAQSAALRLQLDALDAVVQAFVAGHLAQLARAAQEAEQAGMATRERLTPRMPPTFGAPQTAAVMPDVVPPSPADATRALDKLSPAPEVMTNG